MIFTPAIAREGSILNRCHHCHSHQGALKEHAGEKIVNPKSQADEMLSLWSCRSVHHLSAAISENGEKVTSGLLHKTQAYRERVKKHRHIALADTEQTAAAGKRLHAAPML